MPFSIRSSGLEAASMLEAQSLRTEAGVKIKKRSRSMFSGLKRFYCRVGVEKRTKISAEILTNCQKLRKVICSALLPKFADVNIWANKPWHLNRMVTHVEKVISIGKNADSNLRKKSFKNGPIEFGLKIGSMFRTVGGNFQTRFLFRYGEKKTEIEFESFSAKMKYKVLIVLMLAMLMVLQACKEKSWRGHRVLCCHNGTAIRKLDKWIWVQSSALLFAPHGRRTCQQKAWQQ